MIFKEYAILQLFTLDNYCATINNTHEQNAVICHRIINS